MKTFFGTNFKKNLFFIVAIIIFFAMVLFTVLQFNNNKTVQKEILILEQQKLSKTNDLMLSYMNQITYTNGYFSSVVLREHEYPLLERDVQWYSSLNERASLCVSLMDYIRLIKITKGNASYQTASANFYDVQVLSDTNKLLHVGEMNATEILCIKDFKVDSLVFRLSPKEGDYAQNNVLIIVNTILFGQCVFGKTENESNITCVVDKNGTVVLSNQQDTLNKNIFSFYKIKGNELKTGQRMVTLNGVKYSYCIEKIGGLDLFSVSLTNQDFYSSYYKTMEFRTISFGLILFLVAFLLSVIIAYRTYSPINRLIRSLDDYMPEAYNEKSIDEIVYIQDNIAKLYLNNRDLNRSVHEDIILLKNQQAIALQSQISPHFIYNTLDAINWKATDLLGRKNPISKCIINMANVIRYSMDSSTLFAPLSEEISISKKYVEILKIRYNEKYDVEWDIDESLLNCKVIKICIQPIIENAVFHGVSNISIKGQIKVRVYSDSNDLKIEVIDNGVGISDEKLEEINIHINDFKSSPANHIGIRNVNLRLKLLYGDKYGAFIKNGSVSGAMCYILIPIEKEGGE